MGVVMRLLERARKSRRAIPMWRTDNVKAKTANWLSGRSTCAAILLFVLWLVVPGATAQTVLYIHTDSLGSVTTVTDQNRNIVERREYEPYGQILTGVKDGPGYAGHVLDAQTGLSYMQQRYYDPQIGRFLSVDPVTAYSDPMKMFNRYRYAANNPYGFTDPDGRQECRSCEASYGAGVGLMMGDDPERMRVWAGGEAAATTTAGHGTSALEGAAIGQAIRGFISTGEVSKEAVATLATAVVVAAATHGKSTGGAMHGPSPRINLGQQGKHQVGHNNYTSGRSVLTANPSDLGNYAGTGQQVGKVEVGLPGSKERVNFGQEIGTYVDPAGGSSSTTNGIIHYGKEGIHIVPARPNP